MPGEIILHGFWRSSCTWRVRTALALKKIPYTVKPVNLSSGEQFESPLLRLNPLAQVLRKYVPTLEIDGLILAQSIPIIEYLEETRKNQGAALLPKREDLRYKVRQISEAVNSGIQPMQNLSILNQVVKYTQEYGKINLDDTSVKKIKKYWASECIEKGFNALETILKESSGRFCVGDEVSMADCLLIPQVFNAATFKINIAKYPTIQKINEHCLTLEAFQISHPDKQPDKA
ncbi:maleylacetoacetate isomerase-like protein [Reticulomyxa filosa]|uniref:Maleylacetoacetate isomerase-like protein n=1 Tax=Reticulomyxa filosa TaxID=46433 RepID=X6M5Q1_RETFI|nr:maleylacetoacetate isomerase-like protein [Reticulomyxa filosa]|eukprot:ETO08350.1 maleylacetoacetate isomerase-like protein [Reticulomyxa filosa]